MEVITTRLGKEIRSRNYRNLRNLEVEYKKIGAKTEVNLHNACEHIWSLFVTIGNGQRAFERMGAQYNP